MKKFDLGIIVTTLIIIVFSSSLAFFAAKVVGTPKDINLVAKNVSIKLTNGGLIGDAVISPGWSKTNSFTVSNNSKESFRYNIIIKDYINTFETVGNLQYKITSTNGYNMSDFEELPKSTENRDLVLAYNISIDKDTTQNYTVEIKYINSEEDQSADMGKTLGGTLYITENTNKIVTYNNGSIGSKLLSDNTTKLTRASFDSVYTKTNTNILFTSTEDNTLVYYFAGDAKNNWVKFGTWNEDKNVVIGKTSWDTTKLMGKSYSTMSECTSASDFNLNCTTVELAKKGDPMYWRIVRTNSDSSIKLLYSGTNPNSETAYIAMNEFTAKSEDTMYVGYMYGISGSLENNRLNTNDSDIKKIIDSWYKINLKSYEDYISDSAIYCNDREVGEGTYQANGEFFYGAYTRLKTNKTPTYNCSNKSDKFTVNSNAGNGKLIYPVALLTGDEISYAGGVKDFELNEPYSYYYSNSLGNSSVGANFWWLMSPYLTASNGTGGINGVHGLDELNGYLGYNMSNYSNAIRPVISINANNIYKSGNGSSTSPYEIEATASYEVTLTVNNGTGSGKVNVKEGNNATFTVTPSSGYKAELDTNSCGGTLSGSTYTISNITSAKTCNISFKKEIPTLYTKLITDKTTKLGARTDFSTILTADNTKTLYTSTEKGTQVYYFAGNATDNWVKFGKNSSGADLFWRIIRTNADGGIRLLYHSTSPTAQDAYTDFLPFNKASTDTMYVGYMYGTSGSLANNRANTNNSTIKSSIDTWYENNLKTNYGKYLSTTAIYCNDREVGDGFTYSVTGKGLNYAGYERFYKNKMPKYDCTNTSDAFSVSNTSAKLTYPIALMTADETVFAGGLANKSALTYYYYNNAKKSSTSDLNWWTMTPYGGNPSSIYYISGMAAGLLGCNYADMYDVGEGYVARPVTSLKSCVKWKSGDGTASDPYTIKETTSGC